MAEFRPFAAVRPKEEYAKEVAALPYDVMNSDEARAMAEGHPYSFLHVDRAEIDFPRGVDIYSPEVYEKAASNLRNLISDGVMAKDDHPCYYIYREIMEGRTQTGIVGCASVDEYLDGTIKKHELTVEEKEQDRIRHVDVCDANTGVIFLAFRSRDDIRRVMDRITETEEPACDFTKEDGVRHTVWVVRDEETINGIGDAFREVPNLYIADGHHRTASAVKVALKRRAQHPDYTGEEEFNFFMAAAFPSDELSIWDYNRVVKDLGGLTEEAFLDGLRRDFEVTELPEPLPLKDPRDSYKSMKPGKRHEITMILHGKWFLLRVKPEAVDETDPVGSLDVAILQNKVLTPLLGIGDPRTDKRIQFVGGIRGVEELVRLTEGPEGAALAFAMHPTSIEELMNVADAGLIMPPKSTWFEPKLLSGLFIHELA